MMTITTAANQLPRHELPRVTINGNRYYQTPAGALESVTTFLSRSGNSEAIDQWKAAVGAEEAASVSKRAANNGTIFHQMVEDYFQGKQITPVNLLQKQAWKNFQPIIKKISEPRAIELPVYSKKLKLAGTTDFIGSYENTPAIIDWKTAKTRKTEDQIQNYFLQATIYSIMVEEMYQVRIPDLVIAISVEAEPAQVFRSQRKLHLKKLEELLEANPRKILEATE